MPLTADTSEPLLITGTPGVTDVTFRQLRQLTQAFGDGVMGAGDMLVSAPGGMNVQVAAGYAMVTGDTITGPEGQHRYGIPLTAAKTLGTVTAPAGATRRDSIVARVYDEGDAPGAGLNVGRVEYRVNPVESTTPEALPNGAELLAYCDVTVGAVAITSGMLTDMRKAARPVRQVIDDVQAFTASGTINPAGGQICTFTGASGQTLTLPKAVVGRAFEVMNIDTADVLTISRAGTDTITENLSAGTTSAKMPAGSSAIFRCVADGVWLMVRTSPLVKIGTYTPSAGTGVKAVTGIGFRPKYVEFWRLTEAATINFTYQHGWMDAAGNQATTHGYTDSASGSQNSATDAALSVPTTTATFHTKAAFVSMDADGFSLNFSVHTGPVPFGYKAVA